MSRAAPSWSDIEEATRSDAESVVDSNTISPTWHYDDTAITDFGPYPLDDEIDIIQCTDCNKVVLRDALDFHQQNCKLARDIAEGRASPGILEGDVKKRQMMEDDEESIGDGDDRPTKKTKKAEAEARRKARLEIKELKRKEKKKGGRKSKGPIDVDRQCGVINDKGLPCSRSLTCKSHSMGAKRAVEGRSAAYDVLLFEWQKATNPSFVAKLEEKEKAIAAAKAAAAAAPPKEKKKKSSSNKDKDGSGTKKSTTGTGGSGSTGKDGSGTAAHAIIEDEDMDMYAAGADENDMDNELYSILGAIASASNRDRTTPLPLATRGFAGSYTSRAKRMRNLAELLREGIAGTSHAGNPGNGMTVTASPMVTNVLHGFVSSPISPRPWATSASNSSIAMKKTAAT